MSPVLEVGLLTAMAGTALSVIAATATDPATSTIAPYVGGGAGVLAVAALVEVTRRLLNGRLIPRETAEAEEEMSKFITAAGDREDRVMRIAEDTKSNAARIADELAEVTRRQTQQVVDALQSLQRSVDGLRDDLRRGKSQ